MADLIFEIGTEELPASFIGPAAEALSTAFCDSAKVARISGGEVKTHATPRRITLLVHDVAEKALDILERVEGPSVDVAFGSDGKPSKAAEGFARKFGLTVDQLEKSNGRLAVARKVEGKATFALLPELLAKLIPQVALNKKSMRWGDETVAFPRPVRWICAVFGGEVVPVKFGDVTAQGVTYGHRFLSPEPISIRACDEYLPKLLAANVIADIAVRRAKVIAEVDRVAASAGGRRVHDDELVDTITGLVEWPSGVLGSFGAQALDMPREVLVSEMRGHQKYASIESLDGKLMPAFCAVANTPVRDVAVSRRGYERVLAARLSDARYFFDEDKSRALGDRVADLRRVTFQARLGSVHDKTERVLKVAEKIAAMTGYSDHASLARTVALCKADLTTGMVGEFPELQGIMGREYARAAGESETVAVGIQEHYLPRGAADALPTGDLGAIVGLADRFDTIAGIFRIGKGPTGANDPFALRRACLSILRIVDAKHFRLKLRELIHAALQGVEGVIAQTAPKGKDGKIEPVMGEEECALQIRDFFRGRLKSWWTEDHPADLVEAVLSAGWGDVVDAKARLDALAAIKNKPDFIPLAMAFGRASNIIEKQAKDLVAGSVDVALFSEEQERELFAASEAARHFVSDAVKKGDYRAALRTLGELRPSVDAFFDKVLVMAPDAAVRQNRLRVVQGVQQLFAPIADFGRIQTK